MSDDLRRADDIQIKVLEERLANFMSVTIDYRKSLCQKLDIVLQEISLLKETIAKLPCDSRKPQWELMWKNIYAIWGFLGLMIASIVVEWIKKR